MGGGTGASDVGRGCVVSDLIAPRADLGKHRRARPAAASGPNPA